MTHSKYTTKIRGSVFNGKSRQGSRPEYSVAHHTAGGSLESNENYMANGNDRGSCSNYLLGKDKSGKHQVVILIDEDYAPSSTGWSHDRRSIATEMVNVGREPSWPVAEESIEVYAQMNAEWSSRYGWGTLNRNNVRFHGELATNGTECPGAFVRSKIGYIIERANQILKGHIKPLPNPTPTPPSTRPVGAFANGSEELIIFQEKLIRMHHDLGPTGADGILGKKTRDATLHEQRMSGVHKAYPGGQLAMDGIPGWGTNGYLDWWLTGPGKPKPEVFHTVVRGDTLYALSRRYGVKVEDIQKLNGMGSSTILQVGKKLRIK